MKTKSISNYQVLYECSGRQHNDEFKSKTKALCRQEALAKQGIYAKCYKVTATPTKKG